MQCMHCVYCSCINSFFTRTFSFESSFTLYHKMVCFVQLCCEVSVSDVCCNYQWLFSAVTWQRLGTYGQHKSRLWPPFCHVISWWYGCRVSFQVSLSCQSYFSLVLQQCQYCCIFMYCHGNECRLLAVCVYLSISLKYWCIVATSIRQCGSYKCHSTGIRIYLSYFASSVSNILADFWLVLVTSNILFCTYSFWKYSFGLLFMLKLPWNMEWLLWCLPFEPHFILELWTPNLFFWWWVLRSVISLVEVHCSAWSCWQPRYWFSFFTILFTKALWNVLMYLTYCHLLFEMCL